MQFKAGTAVYSADGEDVGRIERAVINPHTREVTHLVVRQGFLFTEDKVIPIELVDSASEDRVTLMRTEGRLEDLPPFEETYYVGLDEEEINREPAYPLTGYAAPLYGYPPVGTGWWGYGGYLGYRAYPETNTVATTERNIPDDTVPLKEGARVVSAGGDHVGNVEQVIADSNSGRATHIVIAQGLLFKARKLVPTNWVRSIDEDEVRLSVGSRQLERLPDYET